MHDDHPNVSDSPPSTTTHWLTTFQSLAKELEVDIAVGTIVERQIDPKTGLEVKMKVKIEGEEEEEEERMVLNNVAYYVGSDGDIKGRYVKRNLWWPEKEYLTSSESDDEHKVFETRFGRTSFLICKTVLFPFLPSFPLSLLFHLLTKSNRGCTSFFQVGI